MRSIIFSTALSYCLVKLFNSSLEGGHTLSSFSIIFVLLLLAIGTVPSRKNDDKTE